MIRQRPGLLILLGLLLLSACNLATGGSNNGNETLSPPTQTPLARPVVFISSPQGGDEAVVNEELLVSASATDSVGVTRVQLVANGRVVKTVTSESATGDQNLPVVLDYTPFQTGLVTLEVVAFRGVVASEAAQVQINVRSSQAFVTATIVLDNNLPPIDFNDPTCRALINVGLNFRSGPSTDFDVITVLSTGTVAPIIGRLGDNSWWQLRVNTRVGWVSAGFTTELGNCFNIPVVQAPVTPTPPIAAATPTLPPTFTPIVQATATPLPSATPGKADLVISNFNGPATLTIPAGESSVTDSYSVTITNTGAGPTGQFDNIITVVEDDREIALGVVSDLTAGQSIVLTVDITFESAGSFRLQPVSDSGNTVDEFSEVNNLSILVVTVNEE